MLMQLAQIEICNLSYSEFQVSKALTFTTLLATSADDKLMIFFSENTNRPFMQITALGDNLHDILKTVFQETSKKYFKMLISRTRVNF